jgi:hypothetical protein
MGNAAAKQAKEVNTVEIKSFMLLLNKVPVRRLD